MSQHKVTTETSGDSTQITVDDVLWMSIVDGLITIRLANDGVYAERDESVNGMTIAPYHPRLAYVAPEAREAVRAEVGL
ncbi:hypothetical protein GCM10023063_16260 [Arthrobacter methylotrophus]|uniref:Uncharacterized protein n=1 Tax=Arthrobacter methylotrophus TaxID=121291 RepID=A0ABV5UQD9_9MICC